jgi:hypothetical protein
MLRTFIVVCLVGASAFAQSPSPSPQGVPVHLKLRDAELSGLVQLYQSLTKRKVWLDAEIRFDRKMTLMTDGPVPRAEAIRLIREALLKEGVEVREVGESEAYVSRVTP